MNRKFERITALAITIFLLIVAESSQAQEQQVVNELQSRILLDVSFKPLKKVKITISPDFRFDGDFSLDQYLFEGEIEYKALKVISMGARYGFITNLRKEKDTEYFNRYAFLVKAKKEFGRFEPSLRLMYSNYADDEVQDKKFLRYKAGIKYDIPNCKITPYVAVQPFQDLDEGGLYKTRYAIGADYKLFKKNYLGISYKFDYYNIEYRNRHIVSLGYTIKF